MNIASLIESKPNPNIPTFNPGDTVKVRAKVVEGDKERTQVFQGVVIRVRNSQTSSNFTVRRVTYGVGVERTFPFHSPRVEKVEVVRHGKTRRANLFYLRGLSTRASRIKERRLTQQELEQEQEALKLAQEEALKLAQEEAPEPKQEEAPELKQEETPELKQEKAPELKQEEAPELKQEKAPELKQEEAPELKQEEKQD